VSYAFSEGRSRLLTFTSVNPLSGYGQAANLSRYWISSWPEVFKPAYWNLSEETAIFRLTPDPSFMQAYVEYEEGCGSMTRKDWDHALSHLEHALKEYPRFAAALTAYGSLLLNYKSDQEGAKRQLQQAVGVEPTSPFVWYNLGRVYQRGGQAALAHRSFQKAADLINQHGEALELLPIIQGELEFSIPGT
jgi:tetratricopeptide (TPR) repeat protein